MRFARTWQGLWFQFGDRPEGHAQFRQALKAFVDEVDGPAQPLRLANGLDWFTALMAIVGKIAVVSENPTASPSAAQQRELADNA